MHEQYLSLPLIDNSTLHRFEMEVGEYKAIIEYKLSPPNVQLLHTEVPPELEGRGAATAIIEKTLAHIEKEGLKLIPICPMVVAYVKRHPEWNRILGENKRDI